MILKHQIPLDLLPPPLPTLDNFIVGDNAELLQALAVLPHSNNRCLYLWGVSGSGRSHLLHAVSHHLQQQGHSCRYFAAADWMRHNHDLTLEGACVDDVNQLDDSGQIALFNYFNQCRDGSGVLLSSGTCPPAQLPLRLDLATRLGWGLVYQVKEISDAAKTIALSQAAAQRGIKLQPDVIQYLLTHNRRDLHYLLGLLQQLDAYSLAQQRPITIPLLKQWLAEHG